MSNVPVHHYNTKDADRVEIKSKWWAQAEDEMHAHVFGVVKGIRQKQAYRTTNNLRFARLYSNMDLIGLQAGLFSHIKDASQFFSNRMSLNVIASCIDTVVSKIGKEKTRPLFLTEDGNWKLQRRSQLLTRYMEGAFDVMGTGTGDNRTLYGISRRSFLDACVFGTGATKFFACPVERKVKAERVLIEEIIVDETEGMYETPSQLHQEKLKHRDVLLEMFPKHAAKIMAASSGMESGQVNESSADMVKVIESWHLPTKDDMSDGRHVISIENCTLYCETWKRDWFPFLFKRWKPRVLGFFGCGLAEELTGIQLEINKMLRTAAIAQHLMCVPQVWLEMSNKTNVKQVDNEIGGVKFYKGAPPIFATPGALPGEFYSHLENLYGKAFEIAGISALSATSQKPSGLNAAVAMREYQDIESERFAVVSQREQDWFLEAAHITMDLMDDLGNPKVRVAGGFKGSEEISWKQARIDREKLRIRSFPAGILPSQPAGKIQKAQELMQAGFLDKDESLELLDFPDLERVMGLKLSARRNITRILERMLDTGEYISPEPYTNLQVARLMAQAYYEKGQVEGMPDELLDLLRRYMDDVKAMVDAETQAAQGVPADAAAMGIDPAMAAQDAELMAAAGGDVAATEPETMAQPAAAPVSDLLPIT